jgi:hypothetical protein
VSGRADECARQGRGDQPVGIFPDGLRAVTSLGSTEHELEPFWIGLDFEVRLAGRDAEGGKAQGPGTGGGMPAYGSGSPVIGSRPAWNRRCRSRQCTNGAGRPHNAVPLSGQRASSARSRRRRKVTMSQSSTHYDTATLSHPKLTGMPHRDLQQLITTLEALRGNLMQDSQHQRRVAAGKKPHAVGAENPIQGL